LPSKSEDLVIYPVVRICHDLWVGLHDGLSFLHRGDLITKGLSGLDNQKVIVRRYQWRIGINVTGSEDIGWIREVRGETNFTLMLGFLARPSYESVLVNDINTVLVICCWQQV
jgi:hypothetical protein